MSFMPNSFLRLAFLKIGSLLIFIPSLLKADPLFKSCSVDECGPKTFYDRKAEGWHWYEMKSKTKEEEAVSSNPTEEVEALKKELNHLLNQAILKPTPQNVLAYRKAQEAFMEKSHTFAKVWQQVTFEHPELDYNLKFPTQHQARLIYKEEEEKKKEIILKDLSQSYGLFYVFKKDCPYCTAFSPVVQAFSKKYGWAVLAISGDGEIPENFEFKNVQTNNGILENLKIDVFPALLAVHPETGEIIPLAYGMTSLGDIETRAYSLHSASLRKEKQRGWKP